LIDFQEIITVNTYQAKYENRYVRTLSVNDPIIMKFGTLNHIVTMISRSQAVDGIAG